MTVIAAHTDEEAALLATSMDQSLVALRTGSPGRLRPPIPGYRESLPPQARAMIDSMREASAVGSMATIREGVLRFIERTGADELIFAGTIWDPASRRRSLEMAMEALR